LGGAFVSLREGVETAEAATAACDEGAAE